MTTATATSLRPLVPPGWLEIENLVCGFGDRRVEAPPGTLLVRRQVHGTDIVDCSAPDLTIEDDAARDGFARVAADADALVTARAGVCVGVRTADCVPLLLVAPRARWAAAVHAGWRGTLAGIAVRAVSAARQAGVDPKELLAAIGPGIDACCYEVSVELAERFAAEGLPVVAGRGAAARPHLDLRGANRLQLEQSGLRPDAIQTAGPCTRCASDRYHSYRAEPETVGRQISWVGWADRTRAPDRAPTR